jgi:hypothetical protein
MPLSDNETVTRYLSELGVRLHGPARARRTVLEEIRAGIADSADAFATKGLSPESAVEAALREMGDPAVVASAFAGELGMSLARKTIWSLLITGPLVGIWWLLLLAPPPGGLVPGAMILAIPVLPFVAAAVIVGVLVLATSGSLIRWVPGVAPRQALLAAAWVEGICITADTALLVIVAARFSAGTAAFPPFLLIAAVAASTLRLVASATAVSWCVKAIGHLGAR